MALFVGLREPGEGPAAPDNSRQRRHPRLPLCQGVKAISGSYCGLNLCLNQSMGRQCPGTLSYLDKDQLIEIKGKLPKYRWVF